MYPHVLKFVTDIRSTSFKFLKVSALVIHVPICQILWCYGPMITTIKFRPIAIFVKFLISRLLFTLSENSETVLHLAIEYVNNN